MHRVKVHSTSARLQLPITPETTAQELSAFARSIPGPCTLRAKARGAGSILYARPGADKCDSRLLSPLAAQKESAKYLLAAKLVGYVLRDVEARDDAVGLAGTRVRDAKGTLLRLVRHAADGQDRDGFPDLLDALIAQDAGPYGNLIGKAERWYARYRDAPQGEPRFAEGRELMMQLLLDADRDPWLIASLETILESTDDAIEWRAAIADSIRFIALHIETLEQATTRLPIPPWFALFCKRWAAARQDGIALCGRLPFALLLDDIAAMTLRRFDAQD